MRQRGVFYKASRISYNGFNVSEVNRKERKMVNARKELEQEVIRVKGEAATLDVGSEEYLNACKAQNQLSEAAGKLKKVDTTTLITGGSSIVMFLLYMVFSDTHIVDTRPIQFAKSIFKR